jgi:type-F conjugative transfer system pilin assembly protein TrbC
MVLDEADRQRSYYTPAPTAAPMWQPEALRQLPGVDLAEIAQQFEGMQAAAKVQKPARDLLVFVSSSMPIETLVLLGRQSKMAGAIMVFRGLRKGLEKGSAMDMQMFLRPIVDTRATIQIDPESFTKYQVEVVPTFVLANRSDACGEGVCAAEASSVEGDVSLDFALHRLARQGGDVESLATEYLQKMSER